MRGSALEALGQVLRAEGKDDDAAAQSRAALAIFDSLRMLDPGNPEWIAAAGNLHRLLALAAKLHGDTTTAMLGESMSAVSLL